MLLVEVFGDDKAGGAPLLNIVSMVIRVLVQMVVVVTLAVTVELLVVGDDSIAPSGGRESPPEISSTTPT